MIQIPGTYLIKSENLHFAVSGISSLAEVPADFNIPPCKYMFFIQDNS